MDFRFEEATVNSSTKWINRKMYKTILITKVNIKIYK